MARTIDQIVQDHLGALQLIICRLEAENETLKAEIAKASAQPPPAD